MLGSSVRVKTVAVYLRVSTPLAQHQASTPVGLGQLLRYAFVRLALAISIYIVPLRYPRDIVYHCLTMHFSFFKAIKQLQ